MCLISLNHPFEEIIPMGNLEVFGCAGWATLMIREMLFMGSFFYLAVALSCDVSVYLDLRLWGEARLAEVIYISPCLPASLSSSRSELNSNSCCVVTFSLLHLFALLLLCAETMFMSSLIFLIMRHVVPLMLDSESCCLPGRFIMVELALLFS